MPPHAPESFTVKQVARSPEPFAEYNYEIYEGDSLVARYWHDFRGDENGVMFPDGGSEDWPGRLGSFLEGGGPQPLRLSAAAVAYLGTKLRART